MTEFSAPTTYAVWDDPDDPDAPPSVIPQRTVELAASLADDWGL